MINPQAALAMSPLIILATITIPLMFGIPISERYDSKISTWLKGLIFLLVVFLFALTVLGIALGFIWGLENLYT